MTDISGERAKLAAQGLKIITRQDWHAVQVYTSDRRVLMPAEGFFLHISVTLDHDDLPEHEDDAMRVIERIGQERFGIGFPYNAAVFDTGRLYEGQPLTRRGAHTVNDKGTSGFREEGSNGSLNYWYRALCLPQMEPDSVTDLQIDAAARWAAAQIRAGLAKPGATWAGHRDVAAKACPGDKGYARLPELRQLTRHYEINGLTERDWFDMATEQDLERVCERVADRHSVRLTYRVVAEGWAPPEPLYHTDFASFCYVVPEARRDKGLDKFVQDTLRLAGEDPSAKRVAQDVIDDLLARAGSS